MDMSMNDAAVKYELSLTTDETTRGATRMLTRNSKKLAVIIPSGSKEGTQVRLANALQVTDGKPGDILIIVRIRETTGGVVEIDDASFESEALKSGLPVVVDFWAPWCGPCRMIAPIMEKLSGQYAGKMKFYKINVDENPQSAAQYQAMSIPLLVFFKNGQEADRNVGALPEPALRSKIEQVLG
jgi:thioredoxin 1